MRELGILGAAIAAAVLLAAPARASIVLSGFTDGCFGASCTPGASATDKGLTFNNTTFTTTTDNTGFATIFNLGILTLNSTPNTYTGDSFTLAVDFTSPTSTTPSPGIFSALLKGSVTSNPSGGGVTVTFSPGIEWFSSPDADFSLQVNTVSPQYNGNPLEISAQVQAVPEPGTWALMGIGFACLGLMAYRRRGRGATFRFA